MDVTGQTPEAVVEEKTAQVVEAPKEDSLSPKFAALAKKEKWLKKMGDDIKREKEEMKKKSQEYETGYVSKSRIKENFIEVALENGLTPDQIANMLLSQSGNSQIDPTILEMRNEIKALKSELLQTKTGWEEGKKQEYTQAVSQIRSEANKLVDTDPEFETIKTKGLVDKVVQYIEDTYKEDGIILSTAEACREVEQALVEDALATFNVKKVQERLKALQAPKEESEPQKPQVTEKLHPKTLTNGMNPSSKPSVSMKDRVARAKLIAAGIDPDSQRA